MGKQDTKNKGKASGKAVEGRLVRLETAVIIAFIALLVGFFGRGIVGLSRPDRPSGQVEPMPSAPQTSPMPRLSPEKRSRILELEDTVSAQPGNVEAWTALGNLYFDAKQAKQAIRAYKKAVGLNPYSAGVWTDLGVMYRQNKQPLEAIAAFNKAASIDPSHEPSRFNKGVVLMHDLDDPQGAIKAWEDLLRVNPSAKMSNGQSIKALVDKLKKGTLQKSP